MKKKFPERWTTAHSDTQTCLTFCCVLKVTDASGTEIQAEEKRGSALRERQTGRKKDGLSGAADPNVEVKQTAV